MAPRGSETTRPTTDKVREALMSSLVSRFGGSLDGICVLDAFAGTGALGFEALSRGAAHCTFLDIDRNTVRLIRENAARLGVSDDEVSIRNVDAFHALKRGLVGGPFDLVLLDPPYATDAGAVCAFIRGLADEGRLSAGAVVVYEHAAGSFEDDMASHAGAFEVTGRKRYGKTEVCVMCYRGEGQA